MQAHSGSISHACQSSVIAPSLFTKMLELEQGKLASRNPSALMLALHVVCSVD